MAAGYEIERLKGKQQVRVFVEMLNIELVILSLVLVLWLRVWVTRAVWTPSHHHRRLLTRRAVTMRTLFFEPLVPSLGLTRCIGCAPWGL